MSDNKNIPGIQSSERIWVRHTTAKGDIYLTTSKASSRDMYFLYKIIDGKAVKLGKNKNPKELEDKLIEDFY